MLGQIQQHASNVCKKLAPFADMADQLVQSNKKYFGEAKIVAAAAFTLGSFYCIPFATGLAFMTGLAGRASLENSEGKQVLSSIKSIWNSKDFENLALIGLVGTALVSVNASLILLSVVTAFALTNKFFAGQNASQTQRQHPEYNVKQ